MMKLQMLDESIDVDDISDCSKMWRRATQSLKAGVEVPRVFSSSLSRSTSNSNLVSSVDSSQLVNPKSQLDGQLASLQSEVAEFEGGVKLQSELTEDEKEADKQSEGRLFGCPIVCSASGRICVARGRGIDETTTARVHVGRRWDTRAM
eukprot:scaffold935_cov196-Alexandrium_tamarense.AAC.14